MKSIITPWSELLSKRFNNVDEEYGPHSQEIASALWMLNRTKWLEHVGESFNADGVVVVHSWDEALTICNRDLKTRDGRYNATGQLASACLPIDKLFERVPQRKEWWQNAREEAKRYTVLRGWAPMSLSREQRELIYEYLYEYVSMLIAEIISSSEIECTYFREQLPWFHAGHFTCGWEGDWPNGRMRVF